MADPQVPAGHQLVGDKLYMVGPKGELVPPAAVKPIAKLQDDTTRTLFEKAEEAAAALAAFKAWAFAEVDAYSALLMDKFKAQAAGAKGNMTLYTYDGELRVTVQTADRLAFGPEIQAAKALIDECLMDWVAGGRDELVVLIQDAFRTDQEGQLNRYAILSLRRHAFDDPRWLRAMEAIKESERVLSSARYIRFHKRIGGSDGSWQNVSLNLATA